LLGYRLEHGHHDRDGAIEVDRFIYRAAKSHTSVLAVLKRPWLNHSSTTLSNTAAMRLSTRIEL
jgi:hypothetical protein